MSNFWCVEPDSEKVDIELTRKGKTKQASLWFKCELTVGEQRAVDTSALKTMSNITGKRGQEANPEIAIDWKGQGFSRMLAYLTDWNLTDDGGNKLPLVRATIENFNEDVFAVIEEALNGHVERMNERKNSQAGESKSPAISA